MCMALTLDFWKLQYLSNVARMIVCCLSQQLHKNVWCQEWLVFWMLTYSCSSNPTFPWTNEVNAACAIKLAEQACYDAKGFSLIWQLVFFDRFICLSFGSLIPEFRMSKPWVHSWNCFIQAGLGQSKMIELNEHSAIHVRTHLLGSIFVRLFVGIKFLGKFESCTELDEFVNSMFCGVNKAL